MNYLANNFKRLPPYGNQLALSLSRGAQPKNDIFIFAGIHAWPKANAFKNTQSFLCLPLEHDPFDFQWPVEKCPVLLFITGGLTKSDIEKIAYCLLLAKALIVRTVLTNNSLVIYRRN